MIATLQFLLASKYGKVALEIAIVGALVFGAYKWAEHRGRDAQKSDDDQRQAQEIETSRQQAQRAKDDQVSQANKAADAAEQREAAAEARLNALASTINSIVARQDAGTKHVSQLADSDLHGDVVAQLKLRSPADPPTNCYTAKEERAIDDAVTQYPLCRQQAQALGEQLGAADQEIAAAKDKAGALQQTVTANENYIALLENDYKKLFDAHPPRYRSARCVWLWRCGKRTVNFQPGAHP